MAHRSEPFGALRPMKRQSSRPAFSRRVSDRRTRIANSDSATGYIKRRGRTEELSGGTERNASLLRIGNTTLPEDYARRKALATTRTPSRSPWFVPRDQRRGEVCTYSALRQILGLLRLPRWLSIGSGGKSSRRRSMKTQISALACLLACLGGCQSRSGADIAATAAQLQSEQAKNVELTRRADQATAAESGLQEKSAERLKRLDAAKKQLADEHQNLETVKGQLTEALQAKSAAEDQSRKALADNDVLPREAFAPRHFSNNRRYAATRCHGSGGNSQCVSELACLAGESSPVLGNSNPRYTF